MTLFVSNRPDRRSIEAEVLDPLVELRFDRGDCLADVARFELGELFPVRLDRVRERVQQARAFGRRRLPPVAREGGLSRLDRAVDVVFGRYGDPGKRLVRRRLAELSKFSRSGLGALAVDEEPVLAFGGDGHRRGRYRWKPGDDSMLERTLNCSRARPWGAHERPYRNAIG